MSFISSREWEKAWEVFSQYLNIDKQKFITLMEKRARDTSLQFKAYDAAHSACAELSIKEK